MPEQMAARSSPLDGLATSSRRAAALRPLPPMARLVLRGRPAAIETAGRALGLPLPQRACQAAVAGQRAALWLGPDEWLLAAPAAEREALIAQLGAALGELPHALVDVSHRDAALEVSGPQSALVLNAGCPLDLDISAFPVGMCARTLIGKSGVMLWRTAPEAFHVAVARSYAVYVWCFLDEARREFLA